MRLEDHLLGGQRAAGMAAHAVGQHGQQRALVRGVREDRDAILLFAAVADMLGRDGFYGQWHGLIILIGATSTRTGEITCTQAAATTN